jgi:hypothetical protein
MLVAPEAHGAQNRSQILALRCEQIFGAWRVVCVELALDDAVLLQAL